MNIRSQLYQLLNITNEKINCLESIYQLTEKQSRSISSKQVDEFLLLCNEKQKLIEKVNQLDEHFHAIYTNIKSSITGDSSKAQQYSEEIQMLQFDIIQVQEMTDKIMQAEANNKTEYKRIFEQMKNAVKHSAPNRKNQIAQYKRMDQWKKNK